MHFKRFVTLGAVLAATVSSAEAAHIVTMNTVQIFGSIDPAKISDYTTFMIAHRCTNLEDGPSLYETFKDKADGCVKVVFHPE